MPFIIVFVVVVIIESVKMEHEYGCAMRPSRRRQSIQSRDAVYPTCLNDPELVASTDRPTKMKV